MAIPASQLSSADFDQFPFYDALLKIENSALTSKMSDEWIAAFTNFLQSLQGYLTRNGIFTPHLTTAERDALQFPSGGQTIYNTTTDEIQVFIISSLVPLEGNWRVVTVV